MVLEQAHPIASVEELRVHLQFAIGLELATIPVYLSALYSIPEGDNTAAGRVIQSVVIEEMLHMALAANVLNSIGGVPSTDPVPGVGDPIPHFPTTVFFLPDLGKLHLRRFSKEALDTFMEIEHPRPRDLRVPRTGYSSIGTFYDAILAGIEAHCPDALFEAAARERGNCQIPAPEFYGGAGRLFAVTRKDEALEAVREIVRQGEGMDEEKIDERAGDHGVRPAYLGPEKGEPHGRAPGIPVDDGDVLADGWKMYSHFARFNEIRAGRRYRPDQTLRESPAGDVLPVDWKRVYPMADDPSAAEYAGSEVEAAIGAFNRTYTELLDALYAAFNGREGEFPGEGRLRKAVVLMWRLKGEAQALMKTPSPLREGFTIGAPFEYLR